MIRLLDCTLRDGGYVNDWKFGYDDINIIINRLVKANVNIIEVGFIDERVIHDINRSIQPKSIYFNDVLKNVEKKDVLLFGMIDYGTCSIENICDKKDCILDGIRIIFKKHNMYKAVDFAHELQKKGYLVCLQMVSITSYQEKDVIEFAGISNLIKPYVVSIVDTYGLLTEKDVVKYYNILDSSLDKSITIGYHAHNNFQLGYANVIKVIENRNANRELIVDGTLFGMGKSAGNAPLELIALYLNNEHHGNYDLNQILEAIDCNIMKIYCKKYWGYSYRYFLSSANNCHPNYINYLLDKNTLSIQSVNDIIEMIDEADKLNYSKDVIEQLYTQYQSNKIDTSDSYEKLKKKLSGKEILILGLGKSIKDKRENINRYIKNNDVITIALNGVIDDINLDYIFISNSKRYANISFKSSGISKYKVIATSNILEMNDDIDFVLNYSELSVSELDSSLLILLEFLSRVNIKKIDLAGCDGFSMDNSDNYYSEGVAFPSNNLTLLNKNIASEIQKYANKIEIEFITPSKYQEYLL